MSIEFSKFYLEHQKSSELLGDTQKESWLDLIRLKFEEGEVLPGYRPGVCLVDTNLQLPHRTVLLRPGEIPLAFYTSRVEGEEPRKNLHVFRYSWEIPYSRTTFAVLYHKDVLALKDERSTEAEWEVVAHLTSSLDVPEPMHPDTMLANHYELDGGTPTGMSAEEFQNKLGESVRFWKDHAIATSERKLSAWGEVDYEITVRPLIEHFRTMMDARVGMDADYDRPYELSLLDRARHMEMIRIPRALEVSQEELLGVIRDLVTQTHNLMEVYQGRVKMKH